MLDTVIFNVEHGQSVFFYPREHPQYGMFVDCGNTPDFNPVDFLVDQGLLHHDGNRHVLGNLTLTNYDHDHFSGLPYLREKAHIWTTNLSKNLSSSELINIKPELTQALEHVCSLKETYIHPVPDFQPPYTVKLFHLERHHFADSDATTNNLSQVVFIEFKGSVVCICGDLEEEGWLQLLQQPNFVEWLNKTNVLIAAHHGRENGYAEEIFEKCWPECIVISDKEMIHGTQEGMTQTFSGHVSGNGVMLVNQGLLSGARKVLTTRNDGHIWIRMTDGGVREYRNIASA